VQRRLALAAVILSIVVFFSMLPFARTPLAKIPAFIPSYESALALIELITAALLFGQFTKLRSKALLALACGYLFNTLIIICHALSFPGSFSETGLLGAGSQTTVWLYVFWHGGFPVFVLVYALLRSAASGFDELRGSTTRALALSLSLVGASVFLLTLLSTLGMDFLPVLIRAGDYSLLITTGVSPIILLLSIAALMFLCRQRQPTVLDLWLRVVMFSWALDVTLSAVISTSRFDLGWYAGRSYGLTAASFVLVVLLLETMGFHNKLAIARARLADHARELEVRVSERTEDLVLSNAALKTEISHRQQTETELHKIRSFLDAIIESLPAVLVAKNANDGKIVLVNRAAENLFGYHRDELIGQGAMDLFPKQDAETLLRQDKRAQLAGTAVEEEYPITTRKLGVRWLRMKKLPVLDELGMPKYIVAFGEDITEKRQVEEDLRQAQKMEAVGQLTGGLAHDFNNLLAVIIGNLDVLIESGAGNPEQDEPIQAALEAALSGGELTRRLLAFARRQPLQPAQVNVNELIEGITKLLARTLGENVRVSLDLDPATKPVVVDRVQLETAITNLANNARDAMPGGGQLIITTKNGHLDQEYAALHSEVEPGDYVVIEVSDSGEGMLPETVERIFEPFYTTKGVGKGTGLGLSMVFGFIKQSAGHINVYSEPGRGTTFGLYLRPVQSRIPEKIVEAPPLQPINNHAETILVVEDNPKLRKVVVKQLLSLGFTVHESENAEKALQVIQSAGNIDLVFSDVVLPGDMDGYMLAHTLKERYPDLKILMTSGFPSARFDEPRLGTKLPLLSKPYRKEDLARVVREVLSEQSGDGVS
jgi:PAS domain S-box-containing protein